MEHDWDVAIIGGGPAGATTGALLRRYNPDLRVLILEKARFPREHVGESQLPSIGFVLHEMGAWDKVEAANFPIKIGASYTWGQTTEPWEFEFLPLGEVPRPITRPEAWDTWRKHVALQVDRAVYDDILLRHAAELGCTVRQECPVRAVDHQGDRVTSLTLDDGSTVTARFYCDASGNAAVLRRALGIDVEIPTSLQNVAFWNYWDGITPNEDHVGHGITRVQVRSLPYGWIWFIPLSLTRASVGLVTPARYYKSSGKRPADLYDQALRDEPGVARQLAGARPEGPLRSTTDWSFVSTRACGENWFLVGESLGFADPILAAGLTLTHWAGRHCAYAILELIRGELDPGWIRSEYQAIQLKRLRQHIKFADYWYSANGCFSDLQDFCSEIARQSGLKLSPQEAFRWLSNGGLDDKPGFNSLGGFTLGGIKTVQNRLAPPGSRVTYTIEGKNTFRLNTRGAQQVMSTFLGDGRIKPVPALQRGNSTLVLAGPNGLMYDALLRESRIDRIVDRIKAQVTPRMPNVFAIERTVKECLFALEYMANNYWVTCSTTKGVPTLHMDADAESEYIYSTRLGPPSKAAAKPS